MKTKNNIRIQFVIEVKDTYSDQDSLPVWWGYSTLEDTANPNPSIPASKLALKFAKDRAESVIGTRLDNEDPDDDRLCIRTEWQIIKKTIIEEVIDMGQNE